VTPVPPDSDRPGGVPVYLYVTVQNVISARTVRFMAVASSFLRLSKQPLRRSMSDVTESFKFADDKEFEFRHDIELQMLDGYLPNAHFQPHRTPLLFTFKDCKTRKKP
jgi:hypothetical protein